MIQFTPEEQDFLNRMSDYGATKWVARQAADIHTKYTGVPHPQCFCGTQERAEFLLLFSLWLKEIANANDE